MLFANFKAMPALLKIITIYCMGVALCSILAIVWPSAIAIDGKPLSYEQIWDQGYLPFFALGCVPFAVAGWLLLVRNSWGRVTFIAALVLLQILTLIFFGLPAQWPVAIASNLIPFVFFGAYLYWRKSVLEYFAGAL